VDIANEDDRYTKPVRDRSILAAKLPKVDISRSGPSRSVAALLLGPDETARRRILASVNGAQRPTEATTPLAVGGQAHRRGWPTRGGRGSWGKRGRWWRRACPSG
jgi:hypothetical protein